MVRLWLVSSGTFTAAKNVALTAIGFVISNDINASVICLIEYVLPYCDNRVGVI